MKIVRPILILSAGWIVVAMTVRSDEQSGVKIDEIALDYVRLLLYAEQFDDDIVDAYYGPDELKPIESGTVAFDNPPFDSLTQIAASLRARLEGVPRPDDDNPAFKRHRHLSAQLRALHTRLRILAGEKLPYDIESKLIYDVVVPQFSDAYFDSIVRQLESKIPGEGPLMDRWREFGERFLVPTDRRDTVLKLAIAEARGRTLEHFDLPQSERFSVEHVTDVSWGAYNWYQGDYQSLIQFNASSPLKVTGPVGLACHEGYPGHHVAGVAQDSILYRGNGWIEFSIVPLFSPTSIFSEGLANYCVDLAFPREERIRFEAMVLCPLAGIDSTGLGLYYELSDLFEGLGWASQVAARDYLDGNKSYDETVTWLSKYSGSKPEEIKRGMRFTEQYRAYRVTYRMGEEMVKNYMEQIAPDDPDRQWQILWELYAAPAVPSDLIL